MSFNYRTPFSYRDFAKAGIMSYYASPTGTSNAYRHGSRNQSMTTTKKRKRLTYKKSFKSLMLNNTAAKHNTQGPTTAMTHNTVYTFNATALISQGDTNTDRDGDSINLEALKLRGFYASATTAGAYGFRIIIGYSGEEYNTGNAFVTGLLGLTTAEIFLPNFPAAFVAVVNPKAFTVLHDQTVEVNSQIAATKDVTNIVNSTLLKSKFDYQSTGSVYGKLKNLYVVVVAQVVGGVTGTTAAGEVLLASDLIFK